MEHKCRFLLLTRSARSQDLLEALTEVNHSGHGIGPTCSDYIEFFGLRSSYVLLCAGGCICKCMWIFSERWFAFMRSYLHAENAESPDGRMCGCWT